MASLVERAVFGANICGKKNSKNNTSASCADDAGNLYLYQQFFFTPK
jgi:hypothetical protein